MCDIREKVYTPSLCRTLHWHVKRTLYNCLIIVGNDDMQKVCCATQSACILIPEANHCNIVDPRIVSVCGMCHGQVTTGGYNYIMFMTWLDEHILWLYFMCVVRQSEVKASLTVPDSHSRQILLRTVSLSIAVGTQITLNIIADHDERAADRQSHKLWATGRSDLVISSENSVTRFTFDQSPLTRTITC